MKKYLLILFSCASLMMFGAAYADGKSEKKASGGTQHSSKNSQKSQAGGLPALADEVAELRLLLQSLQDQVNGPDEPYAGIYSVSLVEHTIFGCGFTNDPAALLGTPAFLAYLQEQGISSTTSRLAYFDAVADGVVLTVPDHVLSIQELRLSGKYESELRTDPGFQVAIAADGALLLDAGPESVFRGQMSVDGNTFVAQIFGLFDEEGCADSYVVSLVGVKK